MKIDEMFLIGGSDIDVGGVVIKQPRLDDIRRPDVGFEKYNAYLNVMALTRDDLVDGVFAEAPEELKEQLTVYMVVTVFPEFQKLAEESLTFFLGELVGFDAEKAAFVSESGAKVGAENFDRVRNAILQISCIAPPEPEQPKFRNAKSKKIFEKIKQGRAEMAKTRKHEHNADMSIPNVVSKLSSRGIGYTILNIWQMTVWQLFDQFANACLNTQIEVLSLRWAAWGKDSFDFSAWYKRQQSS